MPRLSIQGATLYFDGVKVGNLSLDPGEKPVRGLANWLNAQGTETDQYGQDADRADRDKEIADTKAQGLAPPDEPPGNKVPITPPGRPIDQPLQASTDDQPSPLNAAQQNTQGVDGPTRPQAAPTRMTPQPTHEPSAAAKSADSKLSSALKDSAVESRSSKR